MVIVRKIAGIAVGIIGLGILIHFVFSPFYADADGANVGRMWDIANWFMAFGMVVAILFGIHLRMSAEGPRRERPEENLRRNRALRHHGARHPVLLELGRQPQRGGRPKPNPPQLVASHKRRLHHPDGLRERQACAKPLTGAARAKIQRDGAKAQGMGECRAYRKGSLASLGARASRRRSRACARRALTLALSHEGRGDPPAVICA